MKNKNFKILFLINKFKRGGAERAFLNHLNFLYNQKYEVFLGFIYDFSKNDSYLRDLKIPTLRIKNFQFKSTFDIGNLFRLKKFIDENEINVVYATLESANIIARLLKIISPKTKIVIRESGMADRKSIKNKFLDLFLNFFVDKIIAVSDEVKKSLWEYRKIYSKKIVVLENGVEIEPWEDIVKARRQLVLKEKFTIINVGSMQNKNKGQDKLLEFFKKLNETKDRYSLVLVGDGILKNEYENFVLKNNLSEKIIFTGNIPVEKVRFYYLSADLFLLYSEKEGCPNTVLEAMSFGLPVISTYVGGVKRIIENGVSGFLVKNNQRDGKYH